MILMCKHPGRSNMLRASSDSIVADEGRAIFVEERRAASEAGRDTASHSDRSKSCVESETWGLGWRKFTQA